MTNSQITASDPPGRLAVLRGAISRHWNVIRALGIGVAGAVLIVLGGVAGSPLLTGLVFAAGVGVLLAIERAVRRHRG
ncbi:hypothetical protein [Enhygromyxa salina]|nr:hypothetical protein [Enhygromyxa salina]